MSDQLSKVVRFLLGEGELRGVWFGDEPPEALGPMPRFWWRKDLRAAWKAIESAAAPVEVGEVVAWMLDGSDQRDRVATNDHYVVATWRSAGIPVVSLVRAMGADGWAELHRLRAEATESSTGKPWMQLAAEMRAENATLARQLAESESALAAATRRVAEVEGLLRRHISADVDSDTTLYAETEAAIDKARATGEGEGNG